MKFTLATVAVCAMMACANAGNLRDTSDSFQALQHEDDLQSFEALKESTVTPGPQAQTAAAPTPSRKEMRRRERKMRKIGRQCGPPPGNPGFNKKKFFPCIFRHTDADKNKMVSQHEFYKTVTLFGATNCESDTSGMNIFDKVAGMDGVAQISLEDLQHEAVLHPDFFRCAFGPCGRCTVSASATGALEVESDQNDENENELGDDESSFLEAEAEEEDDGDDNDDDSFLEAETEKEDDGDDDDDGDSFLQWGYHRNPGQLDSHFIDHDLEP